MSSSLVYIYVTNSNWDIEICNQWKPFSTISTNWLLKFCTNMAANLADKVGGGTPEGRVQPLESVQLWLWLLWQNHRNISGTHEFKLTPEYVRLKIGCVVTSTTPARYFWSKIGPGPIQHRYIVPPWWHSLVFGSDRSLRSASLRLSVRPFQLSTESN